MAGANGVSGLEETNSGISIPDPDHDTTLNEGKLSVSFKPNKGIQGRLEAVVANLIFDQSTQVKAGENDGKTLNHEFVVAGMQRASMVESDDDSWSAEVALRICMPREHRPSHFG